MTPEGAVLRAVMDLLLVHRVPAMRMNSGAVRDKRGVPVFFARWMDGSPVAGISDIVVILPGGRIAFVEVKAGRGKQAESQKEFERWACASGTEYLLVRDAREVETWLRNRGAIR